MDLSKLPDAQRQELEQLQKHFQEHQQKQQEESAAAASAVQQQPSVYDPSQINQSYDPSQAYDQSYYYNYNYNYQDPSQQHQQYDASYYQNYYPNAYQQQHQYTHPETLVPRAVPSEQQPNAGSGSISLGSGQVQDPYGHPGHQVHLGGTQPNPGYPVPPGLNAAAAAAVAALSQLTQFAGTMGAAERANGVGYIPPMTSGGHFVQGHFRPPEVFDRHVGGKKHIAKLKRFQGHQTLYGPTAVQALYPPNPLSQSLGPPPNPQLADAPLQFAQSTTRVQ